MPAARPPLGFGRYFSGAFLSLCAGCAAGHTSLHPGESTNDAVALDGAHSSAPADAGAATDAATEPSAGQASGSDALAQESALAPVVDPAVSNALLSKSGEASGPAPLGLRFEVVELGAELPWGFAVVNRGTEAAVVDFDARLLSLEVTPPEPAPDALGKPKPNFKKPPKPALCRLPTEIAPSSVDPALAIKLEPGEGLVQAFDPRLYCLGKTPWPLAPGAVVSPRFGWPESMKVSWHAGKREEKPGVQHEPFVAEPSAAQGSLPGAEEADSSERRVKQLRGTPLTLGSDFADSDRPVKSAFASGPALELSIAGGDASSEGSAVATTTLVNRGRQKQDVFFRREFVSYEASGPDGVFQCDPKPDNRAPVDRSAIVTLRPGGKFSAVSRLIEMCPAHAFARPGLYLVHGRFDGADAGADLGLHAFMGRLVSRKPALVRIRQGELPFTPLTSAVRVHVGE